MPYGNGAFRYSCRLTVSPRSHVGVRHVRSALCSPSHRATSADEHDRTRPDRAGIAPGVVLSDRHAAARGQAGHRNQNRCRAEGQQRHELGLRRAIAGSKEECSGDMG